MVIRLLILLLLLMAGPLRAESPPLAPGGVRLMILHDHGNPVVAEMVRLTLRGEYDLTVSLEELRFPDAEGYEWMQIDRDRWFQERIGGRMIQIFERDIALFPRRAGDLAVGPIAHRLTHVTAQGRREQVTVTSAPARVTVRPFPHEARPMTARSLVLTDELSAPPGRLAQTDVLTRRVTIEALGTMAHHLPPRPDLAQPWLIGFTLPETRETIATPDGPVARVVWEWQLRPRTGEPGVLPAVPFVWFDTDTRRIEIAAMQPIPFGFAGFSTASGTSAQVSLSARLAMAGWALAGFGAVLAVVLRGRLPALSRGLRRLMRGPHRARMARAAEKGHLTALRAAVGDDLDWRGEDARRQSLLALLDRQIFDPQAGQAFDAQGWLRSYLRGDR